MSHAEEEAHDDDHGFLFEPIADFLNHSDDDEDHTEFAWQVGDLENPFDFLTWYLNNALDQDHTAHDDDLFSFDGGEPFAGFWGGNNEELGITLA